MSDQKVDLMKYTSPATGYDVLLAELNKKDDSKHEKIIKVFEVFDKMIPLLGFYAEIMKTIRRELLDAVFSDFEFTGKDSKVERMSYYQLYKKLVETRDENCENLKEQLEQKKNELKVKESEIKDKNTEIKQLNKNLENGEQKIKQLENVVAEKNIENANLEKKLLKTEGNLKRKIEQLEKEIVELKADLDQKSEKIRELTPFKNGYDEINDAFSPENELNEAKNQIRQLNMNRKNQIANDILNAKKLEEQLLVLINITTEEYDRFIEKQNETLKKRLMPAPRSHSSSYETTPELSRPSTKISSLNLEKQEKEELYKQQEKERSNYKNSIMELKREYDMTVQHRMGLEEKMYQMEVDKETAEFVKQQKVRVAVHRSQGEMPNLLTGLEEHYDPIRKGADKDIFMFQDRVFSKWACRMQTSVDGQIWYDAKNVAFCENCGEKTLICPHKLALNEDIMEVPVGTKYLKFTRPRLQYNQNLVKRGLDVYKKQMARIDHPDLRMSVSNILTNYLNEFPVELEPKLREESIRGLNEGNPNIGMPHNFQRIWYDFTQRSGFKRQVPRHLTYDRTVSMIQQFLAYLHNKEVYAEVEPCDIVETLYEFFEKRYEIDDIKYAAVYDFLASISFYAGISRFIELVCHALIGNFDRGILNYALYVGELISKIEWTDCEDAKIFFAIIYPYCDDDELEELVLEFTSFGENKINKKLVWDFILMHILRKREFLVNEVEARLGSKVSNDNYTMTEGEFYRAIEEFFMLNDETQIRIAYRTALAHSKWDSFHDCVPVTKLSHIAAYYCLMQIVNELQGNLQKIMNESRQKMIENELKYGAAPKKINNYVEPQGEFVVMSDIDKMSIINRELE